MTSIRERLSALRNLAREGAPVDAAELVELQTRVAAEDQIAELAAEGERTREAEKAERERLAAIATAQETARALVTDAKTEFNAAYADAVAAVIALVDAGDNRRAALIEAVQTLQRAGAPTVHDDGHGTVAVASADTSTPVVVVDGEQHSDRGLSGEFLRCMIHDVVYAPKYRQQDGSTRSLRMYGGTPIEYKLGAPDRSALPQQ
ncbi:hypothetical protein ACYAFX_03455 [Rhodococcus aetherivorans]